MERRGIINQIMQAAVRKGNTPSIGCGFHADWTLVPRDSACPLLVQSVLQDRLHVAVGHCPDVDSGFAGRFQAVIAKGLTETQDAQAGAVALLRMSALMQDTFHNSASRRPADLSKRLKQLIPQSRRTWQ
jgi:hypothetical protein